jgi:hypothetical protein
MGNESARTYMIGDIFRNLPGPYSDNDKPGLRSDAVVNSPSEVLVQDVVLHGDLFGPLSPRFGACDLMRRSQDAGFDFGDFEVLGRLENVPCLGRGIAAHHTPDVPRYGEMVRFAFDRLGWDPDRFEVYRCRMEYPVMPSRVVVWFPLPERNPVVSAGA